MISRKHHQDIPLVFMNGRELDIASSFNHLGPSIFLRGKNWCCQGKEGAKWCSQDEGAKKSVEPEGQLWS